MERRFRVRLAGLLGDAQVRPSLLRGALPRLEAFLRPFVEILPAPEQQTNARHYVQGLLSDLDGKDVESIAYLHDRERQGLQKFIGQACGLYENLARFRREMGAGMNGTDLGRKTIWPNSLWHRTLAPRGWRPHKLVLR